jgi:transcriptional regulator with XRE-family HTH domain
MKHNKGLKPWVDAEIKKDRLTNEAFGKRYNISEPTVRRLRRGERVAQSTIEKLAEGAQYKELADFLRMIATFDADPNATSELDAEIEARLPTLKDDQKQIVLDFIETLQKRNKGAA